MTTSADARRFEELRRVTAKVVEEQADAHDPDPYRAERRRALEAFGVTTSPGS